MSKDDNEYAREIVSLIRLGEALKYDHNHNVALELFNKALIKCSEHGIDLYEDFALQHKGKCLLELSRIEEAVRCFERVGEIREVKANDYLMSSTQQAIGLDSKLSETLLD